VVGFSVAVWARLSAPSPDAGVIPERIARVAFGTEPQGPEAAVPLELDRVGQVRALDFQGEGARDLIEFLATRRVAGLGICYADQGPHTVRVRLGQPVEVIEAEEDARACLERLFRAWPWPDEARGVIVIELETAVLL